MDPAFVLYLEHQRGVVDVSSSILSLSTGADGPCSTLTVCKAALSKLVFSLVPPSRRSRATCGSGMPTHELPYD
jgi:hypothetical protein